MSDLKQPRLVFATIGKLGDFANNGDHKAIDALLKYHKPIWGGESTYDGVVTIGGSGIVQAARIEIKKCTGL